MFEFMGDLMNERDYKPLFYHVFRIFDSFFVSCDEKQNIVTVCWWCQKWIWGGNRCQV